MKLIHIVAAGAAAAAVVSSAPVTGAVVAGVLLGSAALAVRNSSEIMESGTGTSTVMPLPISGETPTSTLPYSQTEHQLLRVIRNAGKQDRREMRDSLRLKKETLTEQKGCLEKRVGRTGKCKYISHCDVSIRVSHESKFKDMEPYSSVPCFEKRMGNGNGIEYPALTDVDAGIKPGSAREDLNLKKINFGSDLDGEPQVSAQNKGSQKLVFRFSEACGGETVSLKPGETKEIPDVEAMCASLSEVENVRRH